MTTAGIAELKASLSEYLARVEAGEDVIVTDQGRPVARLTQLTDPSREAKALIQRGILQHPTRKLDLARVINCDLPEDPEGRTLRALLEDREHAR